MLNSEFGNQNITYDLSKLRWFEIVKIFANFADCFLVWHWSMAENYFSQYTRSCTAKQSRSTCFVCALSVVGLQSVRALSIYTGRTTSHLSLNSSNKFRVIIKLLWFLPRGSKSELLTKRSTIGKIKSRLIRYT